MSLRLALGTTTVLGKKESDLEILIALNAGFADIDTAESYLYEESDGVALSHWSEEREETHIITMFGHEDTPIVNEPGTSLTGSLHKMGLDS